jgi:hypothetical protein
MWNMPRKGFEEFYIKGYQVPNRNLRIFGN